MYSMLLVWCNKRCILSCVFWTWRPLNNKHTHVYEKSLLAFIYLRTLTVLRTVAVVTKNNYKSDSFSNQCHLWTIYGRI